LGQFAIVLVAACACGLQSADGAEGPWRGLAKRIRSASRPDSAAVLVLFDEDVVEGLRSRLPQSFKVVPFRYPGVSGDDAFVPGQLVELYREASAATWEDPDVWVVGRLSGSTARRRAARFADMVASMSRSRVLRDSVMTSRGTVAFSRWVDRPGGVAQREEMRRAQAYADSVLARGVPKPIPITRPFSPTELEIDRDTLSFYVARLADTSFYSIGGCSDVEIVFWYASERLAQMGPGVLPVLVERIEDPSPFVRERVQDALLMATQDERIWARTNGEYLKFYDQPASSSRDIVRAWWANYGHYWTPADSTR
jgi:hypothetical protein